jgi:purine-nucleoside/S-methyl-5'-thioadenosine phosphorylase / adenosine deaminase
MQRAEYLESGLLRDAGFRHAFFTRRGGVSNGSYASLNFSVSVGDDPGHVAQNLERAAHALAVPPSRVYFLSQVHGTDVCVLDGRETRDGVLERRGDALVSRAPDVACGVRTADCVPVLIADRRSGAVAAVHAGWRGVVAGVVRAAVETLRGVVGDDGELAAAVGPHIALEAFEVSEDVARELALASPDPDVVVRDRWPKPHVDLRRIVHAQLEALGLPRDAVDDVWGSTAGEAEWFFSYRRDGPNSGRHLSAIVAAPR